jgi:hypothetical protein
MLFSIFPLLTIHKTSAHKEYLHFTAPNIITFPFITPNGIRPSYMNNGLFTKSGTHRNHRNHGGVSSCAVWTRSEIRLALLIIHSQAKAELFSC